MLGNLLKESQAEFLKKLLGKILEKSVEDFSKENLARLPKEPLQDFFKNSLENVLKWILEKFSEVFENFWFSKRITEQIKKMHVFKEFLMYLYGISKEPLVKIFEWFF